MTELEEMEGRSALSGSGAEDENASEVDRAVAMTLQVGTSIVLLSTLWFLTGLPVAPTLITDSSSDRPLGAVGSLTARSSQPTAQPPLGNSNGLDDVGANTTGRAAAPAVALVPTVHPVSGWSDRGRADSLALVSESQAAPITDPLSAVADAEVCSELVTHGADGTRLSEWQCDPVVDGASPERFFFYMRVRSRTDTTVEHRWYRAGVLDQVVHLDIAANNGPGYRTYSVRTVSPIDSGRWRVEAWANDGKLLLYAEDFVGG